MAIEETNFYFQRFGFCERQISTPPHPSLRLVVVIPCFNEPDLVGSLESLRVCDRPKCAVEVIVVINSPRDCNEQIRSQNQATLEAASKWIACHFDPRFAFHLLHFPDLPSKQAGVGLARKIGMDEALRRLDDAGGLNGIIVGYDADCRCERNYLAAIEKYFQQHPRCPGCSIYFEHPLAGSLDPLVYEAVAAYELHLRYYVQALRFAGFAHAHHTIGSCMAVRAEAYRKQGGMNKRKAGEDFYFLHKIIPLGGFGDLTETIVTPLSRPSDRVPFGTGKAVRACLDGGEISTYPVKAFLDLKRLLACLQSIRLNGEAFAVEAMAQLPSSVRSFLKEQRFDQVLKEIRQNTADETTFRKRLFNWFDGFRAMKFMNRARDGFHGEGRVGEEAAMLLDLLPGEPKASSNVSVRELLRIYRGLDRAG